MGNGGPQPSPAQPCPYLSRDGEEKSPGRLGDVEGIPGPALPHYHSCRKYKNQKKHYKRLGRIFTF